MRADLGRRAAYDERARDRDHRRGDLERQRERTAAQLATWTAEVRGGRRPMTRFTEQAMAEAAGRLARLDGELAELG